MDDLISRELALKESHKIVIEGEIFDVVQVESLLGLPSSGLERKKGKWIDGMLYYDFDESEWEKVKCSVCKNFVVKQIFYHDNKYHFCPYCGAEMRLE